MKKRKSTEGGSSTKYTTIISTPSVDVDERETLKARLYVGCKVHAKQKFGQLVMYPGEIKSIGELQAEILWDSLTVDWVDIDPQLIEPIDETGRAKRRRR